MPARARHRLWRVPGSPIRSACDQPWLRARIRRVEMQWQEIQRLLRRSAIAEIEGDMIKIEADGEPGAVFQRSERVVARVAADVE